MIFIRKGPLSGHFHNVYACQVIRTGWSGTTSTEKCGAALWAVALTLVVPIVFSSYGNVEKAIRICVLDEYAAYLPENHMCIILMVIFRYELCLFVACMLANVLGKENASRKSFRCQEFRVFLSEFHFTVGGRGPNSQVRLPLHCILANYYNNFDKFELA